jgi:hypothetical protein
MLRRIKARDEGLFQCALLHPADADWRLNHERSCKNRRQTSGHTACDSAGELAAL